MGFWVGEKHVNLDFEGYIIGRQVAYMDLDEVCQYILVVEFFLKSITVHLFKECVFIAEIPMVS